MQCDSVIECISIPTLSRYGKRVRYKQTWSFEGTDYGEKEAGDINRYTTRIIILIMKESGTWEKKMYGEKWLSSVI